MITITKTFSAAGVSEPLYVRPGEDFDYSTTAAGGFAETAVLESSNNGGQSWDTVRSGIAITIASTRVRNYDAKPVLYRFRATQVGPGWTGTLAVTLAEVSEDIASNQFKNSSGVVVASATEEGFRTDKLTAGALVLGSTQVTATAAELNLSDVSVQAETIVKAGVVSVTKLNTKIDSTTGAGAVTLAVPDASMYGKIKTIEMTVDGGDITLALTNVVGGSAATTATFANVGETLVLLGGTAAWIVLKEYGVVLS